MPLTKIKIILANLLVSFFEILVWNSTVFWKYSSFSFRFFIGKIFTPSTFLFKKNSHYHNHILLQYPGSSSIGAFLESREIVSLISLQGRTPQGFHYFNLGIRHSSCLSVLSETLNIILPFNVFICYLIYNFLKTASTLCNHFKLFNFILRKYIFLLLHTVWIKTSVTTDRQKSVRVHFKQSAQSTDKAFNYEKISD